MLLDMNGTFMFGHDRLGRDENFFATYESFGGRNLQREQLLRIMHATCDALLREYERPERFDNFPSLTQALREYGRAEETEIPILQRVFAAHEIGRVPPAHRTFLQHTARTHRLGVVSNIWAESGPWLELLRNDGLLPLFERAVFSSDGKSIKPSHALFKCALSYFPADAAIVFVGDSLTRDIIPAKELGLSTVWIAPSGSAHDAADRVVADLPDLAQLAA
ncbi:MAG: HAD family hydrolase [Pirellulales bacterium]